MPEQKITVSDVVEELERQCLSISVSHIRLIEGLKDRFRVSEQEAHEAIQRAIEAKALCAELGFYRPLRCRATGSYYVCQGSLNKLAENISKWSTSKGWSIKWGNVPEKLMLVVTELAEAMEWYRYFSADDMVELEKGLKELTSERGEDSLVQFRIEMADAVIRLLNMSSSLGIDIEKEIAAKMERNEKRPFKHGGKNC